ncbi:MAG: class I SAM-dependent methyltransferase [Deltaproteobacteria bacterium]|nr:class I SAM-dependent methyltransferase [Deltaproteobacteria bacterium]
MAKATGLDPQLHEYLVEHRSPDDAVLEALRDETREATGLRAGMQVAPEQGTFLRILVAAIGAKRAVEVGTFTGYSSLSIARGLPEDGSLLCCDVSEEWTSIARRYWEKAGVSDRIELRLGPAADTLRGLPEEESFDFAFIDADKTGYRTYYEEILKRLRPGGLIALDNVLWHGAIVNPDADDADTLALREINDHVASDDRVDSVMLALSDGLTIARKR